MVLPLLAGLVCVNFLNKRWVEWFAACAAFGTILLKSLCGYEYITSVMLGLILFPVAEWIGSIAAGDRIGAQRWFRCVFRMGCAALVGFAAALFLHAALRGDGSVLKGLQTIWREDVVRRTWGTDPDQFAQELALAESMDASAWQVLMQYLDFTQPLDTQVLAGVDANLFVPMILLAGVSAAYLYQQEQCVRDPALYLFSALIPTSWFILAKAHSYVHGHMNFVLWYIGFVPICLYLIARAAVFVLQNAKITSGAKE